MSFDHLVVEHLRTTILRLLVEQPDYALNDSLLKDMVLGYGFRPSRDRIRTQLAWLDEQGLVALDTRDSSSSCLVARLTERGEEVAKGYASVPGVKRPAPGDV